MMQLLDFDPPHVEGSRATARDAHEARPPGTIISVVLHGSDVDCRALQRLLLQLRLHHPACAVAINLDRADLPTLIELIPIASTRFTRAVLADSSVTIGALRDRLTEPQYLPSDVVAWCTLRGADFDPLTASLIEGIGRSAIGGLARGRSEVGYSASGLRNRMRREGLPAPAEWHRLFKGLRLALDLQRSIDVPLLRFALAMGYGDHSTLSKTLKRTFGVTPAAIRAALSWEWLLTRWYATQTKTGAPNPHRAANDSVVAGKPSQRPRRAPTFVSPAR